MHKEKRILYLTMNNGSDSRVSKELKTLSLNNRVDFLGIGTQEIGDTLNEHVNDYRCVKGTHRSLRVLLTYLWEVLMIKKRSYDYIYVVDEQLLFLVLPLIRHTGIILDIFDSIFLKLNKGGNKWRFIKWILYRRLHTVIVTDEQRYALLPDFVKKKAFILPNYPETIDFGYKAFTDEMVLGVFGTLTRERGLEFISDLLERMPKVQVHCAGWVGDEYAKEFLKKEQVSYLGILSRDEVNNHVFKEIDYIVAIYPQRNVNNLNASPTKVFDAIMCKTPVIINRWVKVSSLVEELNAGLVVRLNEHGVSGLTMETLSNYLSSYDRSAYEELSRQFSWNDYVRDYLSIFCQ